MSDAARPQTPNAISRDATELRLEAREAHKFLLAKTYFDCREYDRCAAVFLPGPLPRGAVHAAYSPTAKATPKNAPKGKARASTSSSTAELVAGLSQKSLFLALYAKYIVGERRMNEDSEMILGPQDGGVMLNKELSGISTILEQWFTDLPTSGRQPQGWLEYLYGIVLAKGKNEKLAIEYLLQSVQQYPYNWGAWQELTSLLGTNEEVSLRVQFYAMPFLTLHSSKISPSNFHEI
jgi:anaphase-promoting complex subunit 8